MRVLQLVPDRDIPQRGVHGHHRGHGHLRDQGGVPGQGRRHLGLLRPGLRRLLSRDTHHLRGLPAAQLHISQVAISIGCLYKPAPALIFVLNFNGFSYHVSMFQSPGTPDILGATPPRALAPGHFPSAARTFA